jgi:hypothetical protein
MRESFPNGHGLSLITADWNDPFMETAIIYRTKKSDDSGYEWMLRKDSGALKGLLPKDPHGLRWDGFIYVCRIYTPTDWEKARQVVSDLPPLDVTPD